MLSLQQLKALPVQTKLKIVLKDGTEARAIIETQETVFQFAKGCSRRGYRYRIKDFADLCSSIQVEAGEKTNPESYDRLWHKHISRAVKCLEASGLWPNTLEFFKNLALMSYPDKKDIYEKYWDRQYAVSSEDRKDTETANAKFVAVYGEYIEKYPFVFPKDDNGCYFVDTSYIWEKSECRLEPMYFGKYRTKQIREEISKSLSEKRKYSAYRIPGAYDYTFEYEPEKNKAWYSKEYKGCGNGHYYIALNAETALFVEDD